MTPTLTIYEQQLTTINEYIETLNDRIRKIDQTEYTETTIKQREFLAKIVTMMTAQRNIVNDIVIEYAKELERFAEVELEMNRVKLCNNLLSKIKLKLINIDRLDDIK